MVGRQSTDRTLVRKGRAPMSCKASSHATYNMGKRKKNDTDHTGALRHRLTSRITEQIAGACLHWPVPMVRLKCTTQRKGLCTSAYLYFTESAHRDKLSVSAGVRWKCWARHLYDGKPGCGCCKSGWKACCGRKLKGRGDIKTRQCVLGTQCQEAGVRIASITFQSTAKPCSHRR